MKVPLFEFIKKCLRLRPALSKFQVLIREDKLDCLKNPLMDFKKKIVKGSYESLAMLEGKTRKGLFF